MMVELCKDFHHISFLIISLTGVYNFNSCVDHLHDEFRIILFLTEINRNGTLFV